MKSMLLMLTVLRVLGAACFPVTGNHIEGRDLAAADARFNALPSTFIAGFAPMPGAKKVFTPQELVRLAKANGVRLDGAAELCFEIPMAPLTVERAAAAMRTVLPSNASVHVLELTAGNFPEGRIVFAIAELEPPNAQSGGVQMWRGHIVYAGTREFGIWARVQVKAVYRVVVATRDLVAGTAITPDSVRVEERTGPIERERPAGMLEEVEGRIARRAVKAGAFVPVSVLAEAPAVRRGDRVVVAVECGRAHLNFEAIATTDARTGEMVELKNPLNGKLFRARLEAGGRALIVLNGVTQ